VFTLITFTFTFTYSCQHTADRAIDVTSVVCPAIYLNVGYIHESLETRFASTTDSGYGFRIDLQKSFALDYKHSR
jgi:hypothetical protein